jgi:hypothetical protein
MAGTEGRGDAMTTKRTTKAAMSPEILMAFDAEVDRALASGADGAIFAVMTPLGKRFGDLTRKDLIRLQEAYQAAAAAATARRTAMFELFRDTGLSPKETPPDETR